MQFWEAQTGPPWIHAWGGHVVLGSAPHIASYAWYGTMFSTEDVLVSKVPQMTNCHNVLHIAIFYLQNIPRNPHSVEVNLRWTWSSSKGNVKCVHGFASSDFQERGLPDQSCGDLPWLIRLIRNDTEDFILLDSSLSIMLEIGIEQCVCLDVRDQDYLPSTQWINMINMKSWRIGISCQDNLTTHFAVTAFKSVLHVLCRSVWRFYKVVFGTGI